MERTLTGFRISRYCKDHCLLLLTLLVCMAVRARTQKAYNTSFTVLNYETGFNVKNFSDGLQDASGFVWLATANGLVKYDGNSMAFYTREKNNLQKDMLLKICEDRQQNIWIRYNMPSDGLGQVDIFDTRTKQALDFDAFFKGRPPFKQKDISNIAANDLREVFIICNNGHVYLYDTLHTFHLLNPAPFNTKELDNFYSYASYATNKGVWVGNKFFISRNGKTIVAPSASQGYVFMYYDTTASIHLLHPANGKAAVVKTNENTTYNIVASPVDRDLMRIYKKEWTFSATSSDGTYTLLENSGKSIYLRKNGIWITLLDSIQCARYGGISATGMFTDKTGKIWVCTNAGLFIFKISPNSFRTYLNSSSDGFRPAIANYETRGIYASMTGDVYVNTTNGTYYFNELSPDAIPQKISGEKFVNHLLHHDGRLYFGYTSVYEYTLADKQTTRLFDASAVKPVWVLQKLEGDHWWIGNQNGMFLRKGRTFIKINSAPEPGIAGVWVNQFFKDSRGKWWVVTAKGLYTMKNDSTTDAHYTNTTSSKQLALPYDDINYLHEDKDHNFWLATNGGGLIKWDRSANTFSVYNVQDGLTSNVLYAILEDEQDNLWISSGYGLIKFNKKNRLTEVFTKEDGLESNEFNRLSSFKRVDGHMYFGGVNGIVSFSPKMVSRAQPQTPVPLQLLNVMQYDERTEQYIDRTQAVSRNLYLKLDAHTNQAIIKPIILDYEKIRYRYAYRIEGLSNNWINFEGTEFTIANLPEGNYELHIKGRDANGQWLRREIIIKLEVVPPFYQSTAFLLAISLLLFTLVGIVFYTVIAIKKKRERQLVKLVNTRTKELQTSLEQKEELVNEIHHRVKNNLQVISGLLEIQAHKLDDENAKNALKESQNRVVSIAMIHQSLYRNDETRIEFSHFIQELFQHITDLYNHKNRVTLELKLPQIYLYIDIAIPMGLVMNELFTNSLKYAFEEQQAPVIKLEYRTLNDSFEIIYKDNGRKLMTATPAAQGSFGIRLVHKLVSQIGASITMEPNEGFTYIITLPSHYKL